jgi:predicted transcriptional regulator
VTQPHERRDVLSVALAADVDEKTVRRYLRGETVRGGSSRRIEKALREKGLREWIRGKK